MVKNVVLLIIQQVPKRKFTINLKIAHLPKKIYKHLKIAFRYLNLDLNLNLNFEVMDLKCLNSKSINI